MDKVCTVCGEVVEAGTTIEKIAHSFGDWTVVAQPTATEKGEQQRICTICGSVEKQEIPATSTAGDQTAPWPEGYRVATNRRQSQSWVVERIVLWIRFGTASSDLPKKEKSIN